MMADVIDNLEMHDFDISDSDKSKVSPQISDYFGTTDSQGKVTANSVNE
jgi:hypothetical protein